MDYYRLGLTIVGLTLAVPALGAGAGADAFAAEPALITTAPSGVGAPALESPSKTTATLADDETASQIKAWIKPAHAPSPSESGPDTPRTIHGEVGAGVGSNGYRSVYGVADIPVGQSSDLVVAASNTTGQVRGGRYGGYGYGGGSTNLALGFYMNGSDAAAPACSRPRWAETQAPDWQASASPGSVACGANAAP